MTGPPAHLSVLGLDAEARRSRPVSLSPDDAAPLAFTAVATECLDQWRTNEALLLGSRAAPHLHQLRVGIRRFRSAVSLFGSVVRDVPDAVDAVHDLRALALPFGAARDLDVLLSGPLVDLLGPGQVHRLVGDREAAHDVVRAVLESAVWAEVSGRVDTVVAAVASASSHDDGPAARPLAAGSLHLRWTRVVTSRGRLLALEPTARHRVRIEAKKLRYGCEFFAGLFPAAEPRVVGAAGEEVTGMLAVAVRAEAVQAALGALNDHASADALLRRVGSAAPEVHEAGLVEASEVAVADLAATARPWVALDGA